MPHLRTTLVWRRRRLGQTAVLFGLCLVTLLGGAGLALDSSSDGASQLEAQGAADAAARSAALVWAPLIHEPPLTSADAGVLSTAQEIAALDGVTTKPAFSCTPGSPGTDVVYFDVPVTGACSTTGSGTFSLEIQIPPSMNVGTDCGANSWNCVEVVVHHTVHNYLGGVLGKKSTVVAATAVAFAAPRAGGVTPPGPGGTPAAIASLPGIEALQPKGFHNIVEAGDQTLTINGDIFDNSVDGESRDETVNGMNMEDSIDDFTAGSAVIINGTLTSVISYPFDSGYAVPGAPNNATGQINKNWPQYVLPNSKNNGAIFTYQKLVTLSPNGRAPAPKTEIMSDPLAPALGPAPAAVAVPGCGGSPPTVYTAANVPPPAGPFLPGIYTVPVLVTGAPSANAQQPTFEDCGGQPGTYLFEHGVDMEPANSDTVYGDDILFVAEHPLSGGIWASNPGNGAPAGSIYAENAQNSGSSIRGAGPNFSIIGGGTGTITLTAPHSGPYTGVLLWQSPVTGRNGVGANFGFDPATTDASVVTLNGLIYNTTLNEGGNGRGVCDLLNWWAQPGIDPQDANNTPFAAGGLLTVGALAYAAAGTPARGLVTINGSSLVDTFNADGWTPLVINHPSATTVGGSPSPSASPGPAPGPVPLTGTAVLVR